MIALRKYIAQDSEQNEVLVVERILKAIDILGTQVEMGRAGRISGTRELVMPNTPYVVPYRVRGERLELVAVFHGRQKWP